MPDLYADSPSCAYVGEEKLEERTSGVCHLYFNTAVLFLPCQYCPARKMKDVL